MNGNKTPTLLVFFGLFALSGFSGLIYESVWTHYLKLFLGHAAYAQSLVLILFMGGLTVGAWLAGKYSSGLRNPLFLYALVEGAIGLYALAFHPLYLGITDFFYDSLAGSSGSSATNDIIKWLIASLVITPPAILLGTTFPFMSAAVTRLATGKAGHVLAWLYGTNSLGAAGGVLFSGFYLIAKAGLPGAMLTAGIMNILIGLIAWLLSRRYPQPPVQGKSRPVVEIPADTVKLLAITAGLTGLASFIYEVTWIRMLSLVLGSATHSFELMLSAFILGLAIGSFWIRRRIDQFERPVMVLAFIQLTMGTLAFLSLAIYAQSFEAMAYGMRAMKTTAEGYVFFNLYSHLICLVMMLPVTICAGMTLPLITKVLFNSKQGETSIGRIYAINTLGAIIGVLLTIHVLMPLTGLRTSLLVGGIIDIMLGLILARQAMALRSPRTAFSALALCVIAISLALTAKPDPAHMASGVFRYGEMRDLEVFYHRDGKSASVSVYKQDEALVLATNGKPDASVHIGGRPTSDDYTQILLGALPWLHKPDARKVAIIGMGSGRSTHTILTVPSLESVETIEIEPAVLAAAPLFGHMVENTYKDPRSHIIVEDARTHFADRRGAYDIIVSEPSNPWVSGVSSLFTEEFYGRVTKSLAPGGILAQWIHLYETDIPLVFSILKALDSHFSHYRLYVANNLDMIIIAGQSDQALTPLPVEQAPPALLKLIRRTNIHNDTDLEYRLAGSSVELSDFIRGYQSATNSDFFPVLDQGAVKARYMKKTAFELVSLSDSIRIRQKLRGESVLDNHTLIGRDANNITFERQLDIANLLDSQSGSVEKLASFLCENTNLVMNGEMLYQAMAYLSSTQLRNLAAGLASGNCGWTHSVTWASVLDALSKGDITGIRDISTRTLLSLEDPEEKIARSDLFHLLLLDILLTSLDEGKTAEGTDMATLLPAESINTLRTQWILAQNQATN